MGHEQTRFIKDYRKEMIIACSTLEWLDDRRVDRDERRLVEAFMRGGKEEENKERNKIKEEKKREERMFVERIKGKDGEYKYKKEREFEKAR